MDPVTPLPVGTCCQHRLHFTTRSPDAPGAMAEDWARYQDRCAEVLGLVREAEAAEPRQEALL